MPSSSTMAFSSDSFGHNLFIAFFSVLLQLPLALGIALLIGRGLRGRAFFRVVLFLPYVLSEVVTAVIWTFIYRVDGGLLNTTIQIFLPFFKSVSWLGNPDTVMYAVFLTLTWKYFGLYLILFIAGLQDIPVELEEAARIDGASSGQVNRYIVLPLLGSTTRLTVYLAIVGSLQVFDLVWVMTGGGPVNSSDTMATYLYKFGFQRFQLGYGSSVAVIIFIVAFGFSTLLPTLCAEPRHNSISEKRRDRIQPALSPGEERWQLLRHDRFQFQRSFGTYSNTAPSSFFRSSSLRRSWSPFWADSKPMRSCSSHRSVCRSTG